MKKIVPLILTLLTFPLAFAATSDTVENISDAVFLPLFETIRPLFVKLSFVIGGIFGATLLLVVVRIYYEHKTLKMLKAIKFDLDQANKTAGIRYSSQKKGIIDNLFDYWKTHSHNRALNKIDKLQQKKLKDKEENEK